MKHAKRELLTRAELARRLNCNPRTIAKWVGEGMPVAVHGKGGQPSRYDEAAVRAWREAQKRRARHDAADLTSARCEKERALARLAEQQFKTRSRALLPAEEVDRLWSGQVAAVRARLLMMPTALSDKLHRIGKLNGSAGIEAELQRAIYEVLTELSTGQTTKPRRARKTPKARRTTTRRKARSQVDA